MKKKGLLLTLGVLVAGLVLVMSMGSFAENPEDIPVRVGNNATLQLDVNGGAAIDLGNIDAGESATDTVTATIDANTGWRLSVFADRNLTGAIPTADVIPNANLQFSTDGSADTRITGEAGANNVFGIGSGNATMVFEGNRGGSIQGNITYDLTEMPWDVKVDVYTATHTYTAAPI